jgi:hypothetical protein
MRRKWSPGRPVLIGDVGAFILTLLLAATLAAACSSQAPAAPEVPDSFPQMALKTLASDSGGLHIELRSAPEPLVRGLNVGQLTVVDRNGQPIEGLTMSVLPWMPSHAHGTSAPVEITDIGAGVFVANPLYLFMAGEWELRMTFTGSLSDTATTTVAIP